MDLHAYTRFYINLIASGYSITLIKRTSKYINLICKENKVLFHQFGKSSFFEDILREINCQYVI